MARNGNAGRMLGARCSSFAPVRRLAAALLLVVVAAGACSGDDKKSPAESNQSTESGSATRRTQVLKIGSTTLQRVGTRGRITPETQRAVLASAQRYVDRAILAPLETGKPGRGYPALFVAGLRPAATGADKRVLTDLAVGPTTAFVEKPSRVALTGLADQSGALLYLATKFSVQVQASTPGGPMTINRSVELTYERVRRTWLVTAYRVKVTRRRPAPARATTSDANGSAAPTPASISGAVS